MVDESDEYYVGIQQRLWGGGFEFLYCWVGRSVPLQLGNRMLDAPVNIVLSVPAAKTRANETDTNGDPHQPIVIHCSPHFTLPMASLKQPGNALGIPVRSSYSKPALFFAPSFPATEP